MQARPGEIILDGPVVDNLTAQWMRLDDDVPAVIEPSAFRAELSAIDGDVTIRVNSPGGYVSEASVIAGLMAERAQLNSVAVVVEGLAASAGALIALSGTSLRMATMAQVMVHRATGGAFGNADIFEARADALRKVDEAFAQLLAEKSSLDIEEARVALLVETWYSAEEAAKLGISDGNAEAPVETEPPMASIVRLGAELMIS